MQHIRDVFDMIKRLENFANYDDIADFMNVPVGRIKYLATQSKKGFEGKEIDFLVEKYRLNPRYLATGEGDHYQYSSNNKELDSDDETIMIPLIKSLKVQAGSNNGLDGIDGFDIVDTFEISKSLLKLPPSAKAKVIEVSGYSMMPMLYPGSLVIFDESDEWRGEGLYILNWRNELMVKLLQVDPKGILHIKSANKDFESWTVDPDDQSHFKVIGKVLRVII